MFTEATTRLNMNFPHSPQGMHTTVTTYFYPLSVPFIVDITNNSFYYQESTTSLMLATQIHRDTSSHTEFVGIICRITGVGGGPRTQGDI